MYVLCTFYIQLKVRTTELTEKLDVAQRRHTAVGACLCVCVSMSELCVWLQNICSNGLKSIVIPYKEMRITFTNQSPPNR